MSAHQDIPPPAGGGSNRLFTTTLSLGLVIMSIGLLVVGRTFLVPLVLAFLAFYLIQVLNNFWMRFSAWGIRLNNAVSTLLSAAIIVAAIIGLSSLIATSVSRVADRLPDYQGKLMKVADDLIAAVSSRLPTRIDLLMQEWVQSIKLEMSGMNFGELLASLANEVTTQIGNVALIILYLFFMLLERPFLDAKLKMLIPNEERRHDIGLMLKQIDRDIKAYFGVKTFVSVLTALISYAIMRSVGLDLAEFWALLIFLFNFIPNVGSLVATTLPVLLSMVQFDSLARILFIAVGITCTQMIIGNIVEPRMTGKTLNLSPLVVVVSLVFWGLLWGVTGMVLCVPITAIAMIIMAQSPSTHWLVIVLSETGRVSGLRQAPETEARSSRPPPHV